MQDLYTSTKLWERILKTLPNSDFIWIFKNYLQHSFIIIYGLIKKSWEFHHYSWRNRSPWIFESSFPLWRETKNLRGRSSVLRRDSVHSLHRLHPWASNARVWRPFDFLHRRVSRCLGGRQGTLQTACSHVPWGRWVWRLCYWSWCSWL